MPNYQQQPNTTPQTSQSAGQQQPQSQGTQASTTPKSGESSSFADKAGKVVEQAKNTAIERAEGLRSRAQEGLLDQRQGLADRIHRMGDALRTTSDGLRREDETVAQFIDMATDRVESVARYFEKADLGDIAEDVGRFARRHPAWVIGGGFLMGLAIGRFLKSSDPARGFSGGGRFDEDYGTGYGGESYAGSSFPQTATYPQSYTGSSGGMSGSSYGAGTQGSTGGSSYGAGSSGSTYGSTGSSYGAGSGSTQGTQGSTYGSGASAPSTGTSNTTQGAGSSYTGTSATPTTTGTQSASGTQGASGSTQKVGFPQGTGSGASSSGASYSQGTTGTRKGES